MAKMRVLLTGVALAALGLAACEEKAPTTTAAAPATGGAVLPVGLFLASAPAEAKPLEDVKAAAKAGETVTLRGRVGGGAAPFVDGRAVLTIVGPGLPACSDNAEDACETPWDYCCETPGDVAAHSATIQVVDAQGAPVKAGLKGEHGIKELSDLIVVGTVAQAEGGVLVVNATGIYVAP